MTLPPGKALLGEPIEDRHHSRVSEVSVGELAAHLAHAERVCSLPEHVHYRALQLAESVHAVILTWTNQTH
jgi:hypothetical protein